MQLGKKSKTTNMFDQVKGEFGPEESDTATPLIPPTLATAPAAKPAARTSMASDRESIHITFWETISARLSRDGAMESFDVKGTLQLRISDASLTQVKLNLAVENRPGVQFLPHPNVDKGLFNNGKTIQMKDTSKGFPANNSIGVMRWRYSARSGSSDDLPITLTAWVNQGSDDTYSVTVEYELTGNDSLRDVTVTIPYDTSEPTVSSFDAVYEVSGDSLDWTIGTIDSENPNGSFEFEAQAESDSAFFPMNVRFLKTKPFIDVEVQAPRSTAAHAHANIFFKGLICHACPDGPGSALFERHQISRRILRSRLVSSGTVNP